MSSFLSDLAITSASWQGFERLVARLLLERGFAYVSVVGESGDGGADVLAVHHSGKRWLLQVKRWASAVGSEVLDRTIAASRSYRADVPVIVSKTGFTVDLHHRTSRLRTEGINVQLWDRQTLAQSGKKLPLNPLVVREPNRYQLREYQEEAVQKIVKEWVSFSSGSALVVLATGLGKTFVAGEALRRIFLNQASQKVLVLAHTNVLVYQLEKSFWPFLGPNLSTVVVNGSERPEWASLRSFDIIFATRDTIASAIQGGVELPAFNIVIVDECHHLGAATYESILDALGIGSMGGPFLIGLTATPWRPGGEGLDHRFGSPVVSVDMVTGLKKGFLTNVDYRMYTDNVDWEALRALKGDRFTPKIINRTLFINQWDDAVVAQIQEAWSELGSNPKGIVFCGTVSHADRMSAGINALGFTCAAPIYSKGPDGKAMTPVERNRLLWDFADGKIGILCAVDVLNEGVDVPDVNLVVFQRVTHSRRIFVQQLGRGLRLSPGKDRVLVLDFVSDVRRFAAGLDLQRSLDQDGPAPGKPVRVNLGSKVRFRRANSDDVEGSTFLREWLGDLEEVESAGDDVSLLRYPPASPLPI
jgi:superfamily II DNA or RNA helicase